MIDLTMYEIVNSSENFTHLIYALDELQEFLQSKDSHSSSIDWKTSKQTLFQIYKRVEYIVDIYSQLEGEAISGEDCDTL